MILFHELPGDFPITSLHYWIDMCNRRVIRKLARSADIFVTNTAEHARKLERPSGRSNIPWFPVPSNIPAESNDLSGRARTEFVIFGLPFGRWQTLQMFDKDIRSWLETDRLTKLHIVGPRDERLDACSDDLIARWRNPNIVHHHGVLPPIEVSKLLSRAQFGLVNATIENWSKSAVFMALAAHGCAVVTRAKSKTVPLRFTVAPAEVATIDDVDLGERTRALQEWYETHADWNVVARKISSLLPARMGTGALP
jgi:glycosyltransferase involved in cell wall biosynthesis